MLVIRNGQGTRSGFNSHVISCDGLTGRENGAPVRSITWGLLGVCVDVGQKEGSIVQIPYRH